MQTYRCYSKIFRSHVEFLYKILMLPLVRQTRDWIFSQTVFSITWNRIRLFEWTLLIWSCVPYEVRHLSLANTNSECPQEMWLSRGKKSRIVLVLRCWTVKKTWGGISLTYSIKNNIVLSRFVKIIDIYFNKEHMNQSIIRHCCPTKPSNFQLK